MVPNVLRHPDFNKLPQLEMAISKLHDVTWVYTKADSKLIEISYDARIYRWNFKEMNNCRIDELH